MFSRISVHGLQPGEGETAGNYDPFYPIMLFRLKLFASSTSGRSGTRTCVGQGIHGFSAAAPNGQPSRPTYGQVFITAPDEVMLMQGFTSNIVLKIRFASSRAKALRTGVPVMLSASTVNHQATAPDILLPRARWVSRLPCSHSRSSRRSCPIGPGHLFEPSLPLCPHQSAC